MKKWIVLCKEGFAIIGMAYIDTKYLCAKWFDLYSICQIEKSNDDYYLLYTDKFVYSLKSKNLYKKIKQELCG